MDKRIFDSDFLRKLEFLTLVARKFSRGQTKGEHSTQRRGTSLEFFDYRSYELGDDFRLIDWNIYNRLGRLFIKLFRAEEDLVIHLLIDSSESMRYGNPAKIDYARRVGAALGFIGITNLDRVGVTAFSGQLGRTLAPHRGKNHLFSLFDYFSSLETGGQTSLNSSLVSYSLKAKRPGLAVIISDLLDSAGFETGIKALLYQKFDVVLIQILDPDEINPPVDGDLKLTDMETGREEKVSVDKNIQKLYHDKVESYFKEMQKFSVKNKIEYLWTDTNLPFEDLILKYLRQGMHLQ